VALFVPIERISQSSLEAIESAIRAILQEEPHGPRVQEIDRTAGEAQFN
jgi:hypothetical protein